MVKAALFVTCQRYLHYFCAPSECLTRVTTESNSSQTDVHEDDADDDDEVDGNIPPGS